MCLQTQAEINSHNKEVVFLRGPFHLRRILVNATPPPSRPPFPPQVLCPLSFFPIWMFYFSPALDTSFRGVTRGAFILAGCFLYENTPIGRQAPLSDTIHCTCIDMKSVLTSSEPVFLRRRKPHTNARCRSCDQIKGGEGRGRSLEGLILTSLSDVKVPLE